MDTYIIRIYRRDPDDPMKVSGLVRTVGTDEEKAFNCLVELCNTLAPGRGVTPEMLSCKVPGRLP